MYYWEIDSCTNEWKKVQIEIPDRIDFLATTGDMDYARKIVNGYVRGMNDMQIPQEIVILIVRWYSIEEVHVFDTISEAAEDKTSHWKCDIHQIIPCYK